MPSTNTSSAHSTAMVYEPVPDQPTLSEVRNRKHAHEFTRVDRDWVAFFVFGCINNLIYVVILSAAVDLVGSKVPKGIVLLADIMPSLLIKTIAPYFIHHVPYYARVTFCAAMSFSAVAIIAMGQSIPIRLVGVMMASLSSGLGEQTFLMLSSFYRLQMVSAWSSGTGGAGLLGSLLFLALTSWIGLSIPATLGVVSMFPLAMLFAYFVMLSSPPTTRHSQSLGYQPLSSSSHRLSTDPNLMAPWEVSRTSTFAPQSQEALLDPHINTHRGQGTDPSEDNTLTPASPSLRSDATSGNQSAISSPPSVIVQTPWDGPSWEVPVQTTEPTSINTLLRTTDPDDPSFVSPFRDAGDALDPMGRRSRHYKMSRNEDMSFKEKLLIVRSLFWPFMLPLFLVFAAEYTMNQGVLPVVLFPLDKTPFKHMRDHYVTYAAIYQIGVFISRSSASYIQISRLWIPSFLQVCTLLFTISQALLGFIPWIYIIFALVLWEGLLGGSTYVHTYMCISRDLEHDPKAKEFALGAVGVADGLGITMAGLVSLMLEPALCRYQVVERGIELCLSMAD